MGSRREAPGHETTEEPAVADSHAEEVVETGGGAAGSEDPVDPPGPMVYQAVDAEAPAAAIVYSEVAQRVEDPLPSSALLSRPRSEAKSPGCREWLAARSSKQCASPALIGCVGVGTTFMVATAVITVALLHGGVGTPEPKASTTVQATVRNNLVFVSTSTSTGTPAIATLGETSHAATTEEPTTTKQPATTSAAPKGTTSQKPATQNEAVKAEWGWDLFKVHRVTPNVLQKNPLGGPLEKAATEGATVAFESFMGTFFNTRGDGVITMVNRELTNDALFELESHGTKTFALKSLVNNKYVELGDDGSVAAHRSHPAKINLFQATAYDFLIGLHSLHTKSSINGRELYTNHRHLRVRALDTFFPNSAPWLRMQPVGATSVAFQTTHRTYLSVGKSGSVEALSYSIGPQETFEMSASSSPGWVYFTSTNGKLLSFEDAPVVTAKGTSRTKCTTFNLVELPNFKTYKFRMFGCGNRTLVISESPINTFYVYRAAGPGTDYLGNINVANLPGVLWYLHNEVVVEVPRKFGVTRIRRIKVHISGTQELADNGLTQGVRFAYDRGICTGAGPNETWLGRGSCEQYYQKYGFFVGCNILGLYPFPMASQGFPVHYPDAAWYTLPERGRCHGIPSGTRTCTYSLEDAGEVTVDELVGIHNYDEWIKEGNREYEYFTDTGKGTGFWRQKFNDTRCQHRVDLLRKLFRRKYPNDPSDLELPEPPCDFECSRFYVPPLPAPPEECNATLQAIKAKGVKPLASPEWIHG